MKIFNQALLIAVFSFLWVVAGCGSSQDDVVVLSGSGGSSPVASLRVLPSEAVAAQGSRRRYRVVAEYQDGTVQDVPGQATLESDSPSVSVDGEGRATVALDAPHGNSVVVRATFGGRTAEAVLNLAHFAYICNYADDNLSKGTVQADGSILVDRLGVPTGDGPIDLALSSSGTKLYVANSRDNTVQSFGVASNGSLTSLGTTPTGASPRAIALDPLERFAFVVNQSSQSVSSYLINSDGSLSRNGGDQIVEAGPTSGVVDPEGRFLYVTSSLTSRITSFAINSDGTLSRVESTAYAANRSPGFGAGSIVTDPTGRNVYVTNVSSAQVYSFAADENGVLSPLGSPAVAIRDTFGLAIDPTGSFVYAANGSVDFLTNYAVQGDGSLQNLGTPTPTGDGPIAVSVDASGRYMYVVSANSGTVGAYTIEADGSPDGIRSDIVGDDPQDIVTTP